ncbi:MAG: malectin domain-containing carbohydrate-binding protein [Bryobacteraceae bacterium]|nr:malectin domain-containing carbohydrate-binding protein [Bryobacteraceae bacterium]
MSLRAEYARTAPFHRERTELQLLFEIGAVERNSNAGRLLSYLCEKVFDGDADELREYNVAVDVFARGMDFDKRRDSIVRVEAARLRKRLRKFYEEQGADHEIQIVLEPGSYVPQFREVASAPVAAPARSPRRWIHATLLALVGASAFLALVKIANAPGPSPPAPASPAPALAGRAPIRILAGFDKPQYIDRAGRVWTGDRYFHDGWAAPASRMFVHRALDQTLFHHVRNGPQFGYDIPLDPGLYELRLHFAETELGAGSPRGGGEGSRVIEVRINGQYRGSVDVLFDTAGAPGVADVRVYRGLRPAADGKLHVDFATFSGLAFVNALEVLPSADGRMNPIRLAARDTSFTDREGRSWDPDIYVMGGRLVTRDRAVSGTPDADFYQGERYGNFNYVIPVGMGGRYRLTLRFAETWFCGTEACGGGAGKRVFHVLVNGRVVLRDFDIFREAGGAFRAADKVFHGVEPNSLGVLHVAFEPVVNYPCLNGLEVAEEK